MATFNENGRFLVPVGFRSPSGWNSGFSVFLTAAWGANDTPFFIDPGSTLGGFMLQSRGLPGIRSMTFLPRFEVNSVGDDASQEDVTRAQAIQKQIQFN